MSESIKIDGGCHCGHVTYKAEVRTDFVVICHCRDCQRMSSSAYRIVVQSEEANFKLLENPPKDYIKSSESGRKRIQAFCPECGTHIYSTAIDNIGERLFNIRLGTIIQNELFSPTGQIWCRSAQPWAFNLENIPRTEKQ